MMADDHLEKELPLTETHFLVMLTMVQPNHGYNVMQEVEAMTQGRIVFGPGTLYGPLIISAKRVGLKWLNRIRSIDEKFIKQHLLVENYLIWS
ncbi:hypothetical protein R0V13_07415 [Facklamia hominis]|uniref:hypothetical protein n=1 Tax=Facklamia hominis TaxID=178214 RepID=UPI0029D417C0|nr:hypothetical protein [Facklamia hominis]WPJ90320.1 hypothetical protein R0V13_07415 [Facklamia hominis]